MALTSRGGDSVDENGYRMDQNKSLEESADLFERADIDGVAKASL